MHLGKLGPTSASFVGCSEGSRASKQRRTCKWGGSTRSRALQRIAYTGMRSCSLFAVYLTVGARWCLSVAPGSGHAIAPTCTHACISTPSHSLLHRKVLPNSRRLVVWIFCMQEDCFFRWCVTHPVRHWYVCCKSLAKEKVDRAPSRCCYLPSVVRSAPLAHLSTAHLWGSLNLNVSACGWRCGVPHKPGGRCASASSRRCPFKFSSISQAAVHRSIPCNILKAMFLPTHSNT